LNKDPRDTVRAALAAFQAKDRDGAADLIRELVRTRAPINTTWGPISRMAKSIGEANLAIAAARIHAANAPADNSRRIELAATLAAFGRTDEALQLAHDLVRAVPDDPMTHHFLGVTLSQIGQGNEALPHLRRAIALQPHLAESWLSVAALKRFTADDPEYARLRLTVERSPPTDAATRGALLYALGKALDDIGDVDAAFAAYSQGAALIKTTQPADPTLGPTFRQEVTQGFNQAFLDRLEPSGLSSDRPIFVLGLPRSGTTLMEQIFVAHSAVKEGGEIGLFRHAAMAISSFTPAIIREFVDKHPRPAGVWRRMGETYLHLLDERFGPQGRIVDKSLSAPRMLGVLAHVFPNARFIWMKRDVGAVAWSCFRTRFSNGQDWSWSLTDIANNFRLVDALHAHWTRLFPDRILTVPYEELVADPETWIPRALAHAGLQDEPQTRNFHEVKRVVVTASVAQVRRPLYKGSSEAWLRYAKHLQPFFDAYQRPV
jgi:tetratricopeptide (TPR) repeat protein